MFSVVSEKGICISTVSLWILLVYTEASLRLKDLKTSHANLSHLFAAHWYGQLMKTGTDALNKFEFVSLKYSLIINKVLNFKQTNKKNQCISSVSWRFNSD